MTNTVTPETLYYVDGGGGGKKWWGWWMRMAVETTMGDKIRNRYVVK